MKKLLALLVAFGLALGLGCGGPAATSAKKDTPSKVVPKPTPTADPVKPTEKEKDPDPKKEKDPDPKKEKDPDPKKEKDPQ